MRTAMPAASVFALDVQLLTVFRRLAGNHRACASRVELQGGVELTVRFLFVPGCEMESTLIIWEVITYRFLKQS